MTLCRWFCPWHSTEALQQNKLSKEQVLFFFKQFIQEELSDEEAKTSIIDTLVYKVVLYDDKIRIILKNKDNITKGGSLEELEKMCSNLKVRLKKQPIIH